MQTQQSRTEEDLKTDTGNGSGPIEDSPEEEQIDYKREITRGLLQGLIRGALLALILLYAAALQRDNTICTIEYRYGLDNMTEIEVRYEELYKYMPVRTSWGNTFYLIDITYLGDEETRGIKCRWDWNRLPNGYGDRTYENMTFQTGYKMTMNSQMPVLKV